LAGVFLFLIQQFTTMSLIHTAETYEKAGSVETPSDDAFAKEPLRSIATLLGDVFVATAFGLLLTGFYAISRRDGWRYGLVCGLVGFAIFHLFPAMVVPPAVPGMEVAPLAVRQVAWWESVVSATIGFILLFTLTRFAKLAGVLFFVLPVAVFRLLSPLPAATTRSNPLALIDQAFVIRTLAGVMIFWLILGAVSGYLFARGSDTPGRRTPSGDEYTKIKNGT
jgi:predicted cobalt transporter CbtA